MKYITRILVFVFLSFTVQGFSQLSVYSKGANMPYRHPTPGEISIMAVSPVPDGITPTKEAYEEVVDCGFNLVTSQGSVAFYQKQFSLIEDLNLRFIVSTPQLLTDNRSNYIKALKDNKHLGGWLLKDEPTAEFLPTLKEQYDIFKRQDPNHFILINLVGLIEKKFTGKYTVLKNYLENFQEMFQPMVWSYDYYPISMKSGKLNVNYEQFYSDLEDFSSMAKSTNRPFWAFCESMEYSTKWYSRPAPTESYLRFEAFSALAYGAQGIVYWTYSLRKSGSSEKYISALVDLKGKKSKAWYAAQKVNNEIKKFNDVFYECNVADIRHTGKKQYKGTRKLSGAYGPFKSIKSGDSGVLVSLIENKGKNYVVIVSRDVLKKQNLTIELESGRMIEELTSIDARRYTSEKPLNFTLDAGNYLIFSVTE